VLGDLIAVAREQRLRGAGARPPSPSAAASRRADAEEEARLPLDEVRTKAYLRLIVDDQPGVLAQLAQRLGAARVSVAQMFQEPSVRGEASITILTHEARDRDLRDATSAIAALAAVRRAPRFIRIFDR
jgi:homoserine dehydrogenase